MGTVHIITLLVTAIFLFAACLILRVHNRKALVPGTEDFITVWIEHKEKELEKSGSGISMTFYLTVLVAAPLIIGCVVFFALGNPLFAVIIGACGCLVPEGLVQYALHSNNKNFEERYEKSLEQLSSSLRAGMSISQAVEDVANCKFLHESMRRKYAELSTNLQMGVSVADAFRLFAEDANNNDANDVALAIDVQNEVGGHEAEVIQDIANNIQQRIMTRREIKSSISGTSSMVWMMDFIAPGIVIGFAFINFDYVSIFFESPLMILFFIILLVCCAIGSIVNHRTLRNLTKGA